MGRTFATDEYVWIPDSDDYMVPAIVVSSFEQGGKGQVRRLKKNGKPESKPVMVSGSDSKEIMQMDEQSLQSVDDMVQLRSLNEAAIHYNLKMRYEQNVIYTRVSKIVIAINPFQMLPIYSPQVMDEYLANGSRDMDPHVYGVADDAFRAMLEKRTDQSCIVSGESGAGKTETTKLFLQYIAEKSRREQVSRGKSDGPGNQSLQNKVLEANPLMEAFGNAKTGRNDNSSRFGKWIEIKFDSGGLILGGVISNYLLEKSRLVTQGEGERNYHIFYQLCAAAAVNPDMKKLFNLSDASQYHYLNQSKRSSIEVDTIDDADEWKTTRTAMEVVGLSDAEVEEIIRVLCGIMHLGNVKFDSHKGGEASKVKNADMIELAAEQLGVKPDMLANAVTHKKVKDTYGDLNPSAAADARDALAKTIYSLMFDWLIERINESLGAVTKKRDAHTIGVLDIFGFESFDINSFEQLCINYCNEKLQGFFNDHIFKLEQEEYAKEGVNVDKIEYEDNSKTIALIDSPKAGGVFTNIAEVVKTGRENQDNDGKVLAAILQSASTSGGILLQPKPQAIRKREHLKRCFIFTHYAGEVEYNVDGFYEKNKDQLQDALMEVGTKSSTPLLQTLFKRIQSASSSSKKKSLGVKFRDEMNTLMSRLQATDPHFVRCIKPNESKRPNRWTSDMVNAQLRYAGVLEVCRIRKLGYPVQKDFDQFVNQFTILAGGKRVAAPKLCQKLVDRDLMVEGEFQVGTNKIFMRDDQYDTLMGVYEKTVAEVVVKLQAAMRRFLALTRYDRWMKTLKEIKDATKGRNADKLQAALLKVGSLPYGGRQLKEVAEAKDLLEELQEEDRINGLLQSAIESSDLAEIQSALKAAKQKNLGDKSLLAAAKKEMDKIQRERATRAELRAAVEEGTERALSAAIKKAESAKVTTAVEYRDAVTLLERIEKENGLRSDVKKALKSKNATMAREAMNQLVSLGVPREDDDIQAAEQLVQEDAVASREREEEKMRLVAALEKAMDERDLAALNDLEVEVLKIGISDNEVAMGAMDLRKQLEQVKDIAQTLATETRSLQHKASTTEGITTKDMESLESLLDTARKEGLTDADPAYRSAHELLDKLAEQETAQRQIDELVKAVEDQKNKETGGIERAKTENKDDLLRLLGVAQKLGIETAAAKKLRYWVGDIEQAEAQAEAATLAKRRQDRLERLREATKDDLEEQAMQRLQKLTSDEHQARVEAARDDAVYDLKKFYRVRSNEDYTETLPEEDRALAAKLKLWSRPKPIPKSLLKLTDEQNRTALRVNRAILQYCGDMSTSFPATLAQYVLVKGLEDDQMCDEIFIQLCKHIFANNKPESADRAWLLMCMATKTFPPTDAFTPFLINFLLKHQNLSGLQGNYSRLCIVQLDATIELGPSSFKPNLEEIQSYRKRPPVLASIKMINGEILEYPISPDLRIAQVLEMIRRGNGIEDDPETPHYGIFVKDARATNKVDPRKRLINFYREYNPKKLEHVELFLEHWKGKEEELFQKLREKYGPEPEESTPGKKNNGILSASVTGALHAAKMLGLTSSRKVPPAPVSAWPLPWWSHAGDVFLRMSAQGKQPVFEFKRRLFIPSTMDEESELLYQQLLEDIKTGDLALNDEQDAAQAAVLACILQNPKLKQPKRDKLVESGLMDYLSPDWRRKKTPAAWEMVAGSSFQEKPPKNKKALIRMFVEICKKSPVYGMCFFAGRLADKDENLTIGVNNEGVHFVDRAADGTVSIRQTFAFKLVSKYGASVEYCWLSYDVGKKKGGKGQYQNILITTLQSWELYELIFDYTHAEQ